MIFVMYHDPIIFIGLGAACIIFPEKSEKQSTLFGRQTVRAPGAGHQTCPAVLIHYPITFMKLTLMISEHDPPPKAVAP